MCGKIFTSEAYLDKHFENRHTSTLQNVSMKDLKTRN